MDEELQLLCGGLIDGCGDANSAAPTADQLGRVEHRSLADARARLAERLGGIAGDNTVEHLRSLSEADQQAFDALTERIELIDTQLRSREEAERRATEAADRRRQRTTELRNRQFAAPAVHTTVPRPGEVEERSGAGAAADGPDLTDYSLIRAINLRAAGRPLDGLEAEVSQEIATRSGRQPDGFFVPQQLQVQGQVQTRSLDTAAAAGAIQTALRPESFIDVLRNRLLVNRLGATVMTGLVGNVDLPKKSGTLSAAWISEDQEATDSDFQVGTIGLRPKTVAGTTYMTRDMLRQTSVDVEMIARADLNDTIALSVDSAAFNGVAADGEPEGLIQNVAIPRVEFGDNGGDPTFAKMVEFETLIAEANADSGTMAYVTSTGGRGKLKTTPREPGTTGVMLWQEGEVNGYRAVSSNQVPSNLTKGSGTNLTPVIFGNFADLIIGFWGGTDVIVDPYTSSKRGGVQVTAFQTADVLVRRPESFAVATDMRR